MAGPITGMVDDQADDSRITSANIPIVDLEACIFGLWGASLFWAVNQMSGGALSIIPGYPALDDFIVGVIIGVFMMLSRFKKVRKLQEIQEIQEDLAHQEKQKADQFSTDLLQRHLAHSNDINV